MSKHKADDTAPVVDHDVCNRVHALFIDCRHQLSQLILVAVLAVQVVQLACRSGLTTAAAAAVVVVAYVRRLVHH
jgi:hypothetical protein